MISGFNHMNTPENGKPAILEYSNGTVLANNVDGELIPTLPVEGGIIKKSKDSNIDFINRDIHAGGITYQGNADIICITAAQSEGIMFRNAPGSYFGWINISHDGPVVAFYYIAETGDVIDIYSIDTNIV